MNLCHHPRQPLLEDELLHAQDEQGPPRHGDVTGLYKMENGLAVLGRWFHWDETWEPLRFGGKLELFVGWQRVHSAYLNPGWWCIYCYWLLLWISKFNICILTLSMDGITLRFTWNLDNMLILGCQGKTRVFLISPGEILRNRCDLEAGSHYQDCRTVTSMKHE